MSRIKYISLYTVMLFGMAVFAGCGRQEPAGWDVAREGGLAVGRLPQQAEEKSAAGGRSLSAIWRRWREKQWGITPKQEQEPLPYPKVAVLPMDIQNCDVLFSEGCYCIYDGSHYGFITAEGEEISPFLYEEAAPFSEGLACVRLGGKYGFIGKDGATAIPFLYDQASSFTDGLAYFCIGETYGFMDQEGKTVLQPNCDSVSSFWEERAYFSVDGLYGYMDTAGEIVAEPIYEDAGHFQDGLAMVIRNGRYGMIGRDGREVLPVEYDFIRISKEGFLIAEKDGLKYCFDRTGRLCLAEGWEWINYKNGFFTAQKDGLVYCFDETGEQRLAEGWDWISVREGTFVVRRKKNYGLTGWDGTVLFEPKYDFLWPIPGRELVIMEIDGFYGVVDYEGRTKIPFAYNFISGADCGEGIRVIKEGEEGISAGYLVFSDEGICGERSLVYDSIDSFVGDRAIVRLGGQYGVIRRDGMLEVPVKYDRIFLFENGYIGLRAGGIVSLHDSEGKLIASGLYDSIFKRKSGYLTRKGNRYGFLNERGEEVAAPECVVIDHNIYGANAFSMIRCNGRYIESLLINTDAEDIKSSWLQERIFANHITPRAEEYMSFLQNGAVSVQERGENSRTAAFDELGTYRKLSKLYRIGDELILYFFAEPVPDSVYESVSGFFALRDGKVEELVTGCENDGAEMGNRVCFWYDREKGERKLGMKGSELALLESGSDGYIYELGAAGAELSVHIQETDWWCCDIDTEEEQTEDFGSENDDSGTDESVLDAEYIREYRINGEQVSKERYREVEERYLQLDALDLYF